MPDDTLFPDPPAPRETTTLADLIRMARSWGDHDIPICVAIDGVEFPLNYRYCSTAGVVFVAPNGLPLNPPLNPDAFATPNESPGRARRGDPGTSHRGAASIKYRAGTQKARLALAYLDLGELTDEQAARAAGLIDRPRCCWWHRCSDLRQDGVIADLGYTLKSDETGEDRMVCALTPAGRVLAASLR